jgi:SAM-dependent methyltransferase
VRRALLKGTSQDILAERREVWRSKPILRMLYEKWCGHIKKALRPGRTLELGGGSGVLKEFLPPVITTDIVFAPWLDAVIDAHALPFHHESLDNIVLFDVLHHLAAPADFFHEVERVLKPEGRVVMMEPYVSWVSFFVYRFLHKEGMRWGGNPFAVHQAAGKAPFEGNQALPTLIFEKHRKEFMERFPRLRIIQEKRTDSFVYPLSGGFHQRSLCPKFLWEVLNCAEGLIGPLSSYIAFRMLVVMERNSLGQGWGE